MKIFATVSFTISLLLIAPSLVNACAEGNIKTRETVAIEGKLKEQLDALRFTSKAVLSKWPACPEFCHFGFGHDSSNFNISLENDTDDWILHFDDGMTETGKGTISFPLPDAARQFMISHTYGEGRPTEPAHIAVSLYPTATGTGVFEHSIPANTQVEFSMKTVTGGCIIAKNFTRWELRVQNAYAFYSFSGKLTSW